MIKENNKVPKVAIYSRVSTEEQAKEGLSVDAQIDKCESFCKARGWEVFKVYKDSGFSAGSLNRPALELLLRDAEDKRFNNYLRRFENERNKFHICDGTNRYDFCYGRSFFPNNRGFCAIRTWNGKRESAIIF